MERKWRDKKLYADKLIAFLKLFTNFYSKLIILLKEILLDD